MKKLSLLLLSTLLSFSTSLFAIEASITHACYKSATENYIEFNLYVLGRSVEWVQLDSVDSQASIEVGIFFKQKGQVIQFDKFAMKSPKTMDPVNFEDFHRYALPTGSYDLEVTLKDMNKKEQPVTYKSSIFMDFPDDMLRQSDIKLLTGIRPDSTEGSPRVKYGYFMDALPFNFYDSRSTHLSFYNEIYNADKGIGEDYVLSYAIQKLFATPNDKPLLIAHKRKKAESFAVNLLQLDISKLESGNYRLVVSIRNRANELLSEKEILFQRSNPNLAPDEVVITDDALNSEFVAQLEEKDLRFTLKSILMKVPEEDVTIVNEMLKTKDLKAQRRYIFKYFSKVNPNLPEQAHDEYMLVAKAVDRMYNNGFGYGFDTDRGRIFLKYGRPDDMITVENEATAPPYEIWIYNRIEKTQQTNVKFLFYNPNLMANGYRLLHSLCRGELNNPRWVNELYKSVPNEQTGSLIDGNSGMQRNVNRRAVELMNEY
ncbi:MAG: GWxTD domain-containing protein [Saprospiraceae bacterium]|nr:GWxTD domain-containing protein [Saprospiraceae bacterium]